MKNEYGQLLLKDPEVQISLKEMILQKANRYDELSDKVLAEAEIDDLLRRDLTPEALYRLLGYYEAKEERLLLERDLSSMCYQLNKSRNNIPNNAKWEKAYLFATEEVRIEDVVFNLLGISAFNRNIKCPFHEDKSPSLKVYVEDNHFVCFSCNARGSPIDFVMKYKNCSFKEAVLYLSNL